MSKVYPEIDMVTTPSGKPVAMVHSNNCTTDLNAWVDLFGEFAGALGVEVSQSKLFELLYRQGLAGDADGGGLLAYNYYSGEHITHLTEGRPLFVRTPESRFTLANFMRVAPLLRARRAEDRARTSLTRSRSRSTASSATAASSRPRRSGRRSWPRP